MDVIRYNQTRDRLRELYQDISFGGFYMFVPPHMFMTTEQVKNREVVSYDGSYAWGDPNATHQAHFITVPILEKLIKGENNVSSIGFYDADDSITLYKKITEYLDLWMDIANEAPEFYIPTLDELYRLEEVALWIFHTYKPVMMTRMNMKLERERDVPVNPDMNPFLMLLRMGASESIEELPNDLSFASIIDARVPERLSTFYTMQRKAMNSANFEQEWEMDMADIAALLD